MTRSQLGGKRKVPVTLGLHEARAYLRAAALQHQSAALLMVDLVEAFYRVLRPLALGSSGCRNSEASPQTSATP